MGDTLKKTVVGVAGSVVATVVGWYVTNHVLTNDTTTSPLVQKSDTIAHAKEQHAVTDMSPARDSAQAGKTDTQQTFQSERIPTIDELAPGKGQGTVTTETKVPQGSSTMEDVKPAKNDDAAVEHHESTNPEVGGHKAEADDQKPTSDEHNAAPVEHTPAPYEQKAAPITKKAAEKELQSVVEHGRAVGDTLLKNINLKGQAKKVQKKAEDTFEELEREAQKDSLP